MNELRMIAPYAGLVAGVLMLKIERGLELDHEELAALRVCLQLVEPRPEAPPHILLLWLRAYEYVRTQPMVDA